MKGLLVAILVVLVLGFLGWLPAVLGTLLVLSLVALACWGIYHVLRSPAMWTILAALVIVGMVVVIVGFALGG